ncbi:g1892 [Coccomyxa viridis]|uniref:G1892 protein n=1 Tax=Coccomyxa viridis TaxID=1274662 RepID=A0ABP1FPB2_9CHLO
MEKPRKAQRRQIPVMPKDLTGAYNTGFTLADLTPEDSMCMFPTYSEAEAMLKPMTRAKKGALLTPTSINNSLPNAKRT